MQASIKKYRIFIIASLCAALCLSVVRLIVIIENIEASLGNADGLYYLDSSNAPLLFAVGFSALSAVFCIGAYVFAGKINGEFKYESPNISFSAAISGLMLFTVALYFAYDLFNQLEKSPFLATVIVLTVLCGIYFLVLASKRVSTGYPWLVTLLSFVPVLLSATRMVYDFVECSITVTASSYSYHITGLAVLTMYFSCEGRYAFGKKRNRLYVALGLVSVLFICVYSIPALILALFWPLSFTNITLYAVADLIIAVYIVCRLCSLPKTEENAEEQQATVQAALAE